MEYEYIGDKWVGDYIGLFYLYMKRHGYLEVLNKKMNSGCQVYENELFIHFGELKYQEYKNGDEYGVQPIVISLVKYGSKDDFIKTIESGIKEIQNIWRQTGFRINK